MTARLASVARRMRRAAFQTGLFIMVMLLCVLDAGAALDMLREGERT